MDSSLQNLPSVQYDTGIKFCDNEHKDELQVYSTSYNTALCNDCYFERQKEWGTTLTLKQASNQQIGLLEEILRMCTNSLKRCSDMQDKILNQESLEDEITQKVDL